MSAREVIGLQVELAHVEGLNMGGREVANRILAALDAAGLAVVPKEPTEEMVVAAFDRDMGPHECLYTSIYHAMVAATKEGEP
jgi:hypothetical protein